MAHPLALVDDAGPRGPDDLRAAAEALPAGELWLDARRADAWAALTPAIEALREARRLALLTTPVGLLRALGAELADAVGALHQRGIIRLVFDLQGPIRPAERKALRLVAAARPARPAPGLRLALHLPVAAAADAAPLAAELHASIVLHDGLASPEDVDAAWFAAVRAGVPLRAERLAVSALATDGAPPSARGLGPLLEAGFLPPAARRGLADRETLSDGEASLAALLGAPPPGYPRGMARPVPPLSGGRRARVAVIVTDLADQLLVRGALPGLAAALCAQGAHATLHTVWDYAFDPDRPAGRPRHPAWKTAMWRLRQRISPFVSPELHYVPPPDRLSHPDRGRDNPARRATVLGRFWETLPLADVDVAVVAGFHAAADLLATPTFRGDIVVADLHLLTGLTTIQPDNTATWPRRVRVLSAFPGYAQLYTRQGVPLDRLAFLPYPVWAGHLPRPRCPAGAAAFFAGGAQRRDGATLGAAASQLRGRVRPILWVGDALAPTGPLRPLGRLPLDAFHAELAASRAVILPLDIAAFDAAGVTVAATAAALGRPVIATATPAMVDHVPEDAGLLVPPADAAALADAIARLDRDDDLLMRLAAGARRQGRRGSPAAWARALLGAG